MIHKAGHTQGHLGMWPVNCNYAVIKIKMKNQGSPEFFSSSVRSRCFELQCTNKLGDSSGGLENYLYRTPHNRQQHCILPAY